jgi:hypothetical protein
MKVFTRPMEAKTVPRVSAFDQLAVIETDYQASELEFAFANRELQTYANAHLDKRFVVIPGKGVMGRVGAMVMDPMRQRLEHKRDLALQKRNHLLAKRAEMRRSLGLVGA